MHALGTHLLVELKDCNPEAIRNLDTVKEALVSAAIKAQATIVEVSFHEFSPHGISGMVIIAESHISVHTWPEYSYAAVDIFTCGDLINPEVAATHIIERFSCKNPSITEVKRGILAPFSQKHPHKPMPDGIEIISKNV